MSKKSFIDEEMLKFATVNAYNIAYKEGLEEGKIHTLSTLRAAMEKLNIGNCPLQMIIDLENHLKNEARNN